MIPCKSAPKRPWQRYFDTLIVISFLGIEGGKTALKEKV